MHFATARLPTAISSRGLAAYRLAIAASPDYLDRYEIPEHPLELKNHVAILASHTALKPSRLTRDDETVDIIPPYALTLNQVKR